MQGRRPAIPNPMEHHVIYAGIDVSKHSLHLAFADGPVKEFANTDKGRRQLLGLTFPRSGDRHLAISSVGPVEV